MPYDTSDPGAKQELSGLPAYDAFCKRVQECLYDAPDTQFAMAAIDIDNFTMLNELYGRREGDRVIEETARILQNLSEESGGVAGFFGRDDFALVLPWDNHDPEQMYHDTLENSDYTYPDGFAPSVGLYIIQDKTASVDKMYDRARLALSGISDSFTEHVAVYDAAEHEKARDQLRLLLDARHGLKTGEFMFFLQPKCAMDTGKIIGAEALVRWNHAERGMISPGAFIPVMEHYNCIPMLDRYVWEEVCKWQRQLLLEGVQPLPVSVNVSRVDFLEMDIEKTFLDLIEKYNLTPDLIELEITESAFVETGLGVNAMIKRLRERGFRILMDDFGTGYSSLHSLRELSFDILKTDIRFLDKAGQTRRGMDLMESINSMAKLLGVPMIVEGVETRDQVDDLLSIGCHYAQGYYFHKPMQRDIYRQMLENEHNIDRAGLVKHDTGQIRLGEFLDSNLYSDGTLNSILGAVMFLEKEDDTFRIIRTNDRFEKLMTSEFGDDDADEQFLKQLLAHAEDVERMLRIAEMNLVEGCRDVLIVKSRDGDTVRLALKVYLLNERDGRKLFYVGAETVHANWNDEEVWNELRDTQARLSFLRAALNRLPNPIFLKDAEARFLFFNDQYARAFGMRRADYIGKTVLDLDYLPEGDRERFQSEDVDLIHREAELSYESDFVFSDDLSHYALYWSTGVHDKKTGRRGLIGEIVDISKWKKQ